MLVCFFVNSTFGIFQKEFLISLIAALYDLYARDFSLNVGSFNVFN